MSSQVNLRPIFLLDALLKIVRSFYHLGERRKTSRTSEESKLFSFNNHSHPSFILLQPDKLLIGFLHYRSKGVAAMHQFVTKRDGERKWGGLKGFFHPPLRLNGLKRRVMPLKRVKACAFGEGGVWRKGTGHFGKRKSAHRYFGRRIRGVWPATETYYFRGVVDYPSCESNSVGASTDRRGTFPLGFGKPLGN